MKNPQPCPYCKKSINAETVTFEANQYRCPHCNGKLLNANEKTKSYGIILMFSVIPLIAAYSLIDVKWFQIILICLSMYFLIKSQQLIKSEAHYIKDPE